MADLPGWPYYKVVSITGQAGAGTDYQVKLTIGDSAGGDFHLEGHCTNFPQDIRITDDDGTTLLDHWVEDLTADPIVVHIEVKDDLGSNRNIRVYYGKNGETTASNGANTFLQYHGAETSAFLDSLDITPNNIAYGVKLKRVTNSDSRWGLANTATRSDDGITISSPAAGTQRYISSINDGSLTYIYETGNIIADQWYQGKFTFNGSTVIGYIDDNQISTTITNNLPNEQLGLITYSTAGSDPIQDWSFVRKYNSPEPAFNSAGAEQTTGLVPVFIRHNPALTGGMV